MASKLKDSGTLKSDSESQRNCLCFSCVLSIVQKHVLVYALRFFLIYSHVCHTDVLYYFTGSSVRELSGRRRGRERRTIAET